MDEARTTIDADSDADFERELLQLRDALSARDQQIAVLAKTTLDKDREIQRLEERIQLLLRRIYGRKSEKFHPGQGTLFSQDEAASSETPPPAVDPAPDDEEEVELVPKKKRKSRATKLRDLPRERIEYDVPPEQKICACCGGEKHKFDESITEEIDYVPASVIVREHVRPKYVCKSCESGIVIADLPPRLIDGGMPGPGLIAQILTAKYADHLPLYRQEAIFRRHGLELSRKTMCDWVAVAAEMLSPILLAMRRDLMRRRVVLSDDTSVLMQTSAQSKGCHKSHLWIWLTPQGDLVIYEFELTRGQIVVEEFLREFEGEIVLADGYAGYNPCQRRGVKRAGCWAHARRYVHDALSNAPREASELLVMIQRMYAIERRAKESNFDTTARTELRRTETRPVLDRIRSTVDRLKPTALPTETLGQALEYLNGQWPHLSLFVDDGEIPIDNNPSERGMRPVALGRKNWLFAGSLQGGKRAALIYSLIETCKRIGIQPFEYLRDVLSRVSTHPHRLIEELTPAGWKAAREKRATSANSQA